jgi:two-component system KDP operon response regulator KdpE
MNTGPLKLLLVEDDADLRATLRAALEVEGYRVQPAASAADARALWANAAGGPPAAEPASGDSPAATEAIDLVLLDLGLPDGDGAVLLSEFAARAGRGGPRVPVLVISAGHDEGRKIALLDGGADDFLVKPFSIGELLARLRVALRHRGVAARPAVTRYDVDGLEVDLGAHRVRLDGETLHLTPTEFRLLARLVRSAGQVVTHRQLLADVWGPEAVEQTHYLRLYMGQLRAKLEADPADPRRLLTEPGVGYRLADATD